VQAELALDMPRRARAGTLPDRFADWFTARGWAPHAHQLALLRAAGADRHALLIAPTGGGKTLAGFLPSLVEIAEDGFDGLHTIYISPLKALAVDVHRNLETPIAEMGLPVTAETRTGDSLEIYLHTTDSSTPPAGPMEVTPGHHGTRDRETVRRITV